MRSLTQDPFHRKLWVLTLLGFAVRVAAIFVLNDYRNPLTAEYGIVAQNLVAGKGFVGGGWLGPEGPTALNTPIYPLFLAFWLWIGQPLPYLWAEIAQAVLSALVIYIAGKIAYVLSDRRIAIITGIFLVFYPPLIYFCKQISPAIFTTFFTALSFYLIILFWRNPTWKMAIISGLAFGVSILAEPVLLLAIPGTIFILGLTIYRDIMRDALRKLFLSALVCVLVLLPWTARNYLVFNRIVVLKTSFGLNLWLGNNPNATGFLYTATGEPMQNTLPAGMRDYLATLNEAERYAVLGQEAWHWIRTHPVPFLRLTARRLVYLWWISPTYQVTTQNIVEPRFFYIARALIQIPLLVFGALGYLLAFSKNRLLFWSNLWWPVAFTIPYAISVAGNTRYRLPVEPVLILMSAFAIWTLVGKFRKA